MNIIKTESETTKPFGKGDLFKDGSGHTYMLCDTNRGWVCIRLEDGHYWTSLTSKKEEATQGLNHFRRDATITIS